MPKGQQRGKETKKPKKVAASTTLPAISANAVKPTITTIVPDRSKKK